MQRFFIALLVVCMFPTINVVLVPKVGAVSMDQIKQQVKQAAEQRQEHEELGLNPSPGSKVVGQKNTKVKSTQIQKKPHVVERKVLASWWNGKIVLESRDGLWVLVIT